MEGYSEPDSSEQEALLLKEEGNALLRAGDARGAVAKYEEALSALGPAQGREQATLLANVSAAQLTLGFADLALEAAKASVVADPSYSKALFREAKALLALRRHSDAVHTARHLLFLAGSSVQRDVERILEAGPGHRKPRLAVSSDTAPPSSLEATADLLALVARCCEAKELARLGKGNRRFWHQLCKDEELLRLAAALCPQGSSAWLRRDGLSPGWTFAVHQAHARCSVRNMVAVCHHDGLALVPPDGGETVWLPTPAHCLDFTLCWGPHGEYLAFTAENASQHTALVVVPTAGRPPLVIPLIPNLTPYYLCPAPCGTRLALLGSVRGQQALLVADLSTLLVQGQASASLHCVGTAAPLYFDWAPHAPEMLLACHEKKLVAVRGCVPRELAELPVPAVEPAEVSLENLEALPGTEIHGRISFRAPQWLPFPESRQGRWLVPRDSAGHVSLALVDPATEEVEIVCEHLPPEAHFAGSCGWVAWCGLHDDRGHGGVFARRVWPSLGPPMMVFSHPNRVEGMTWGGERLALVIHAPNCLVWTVWDALVAEKEGTRLYVAPHGFIPNRSFSGRVLPFFDQFERRLRFWSPSNDAVVYADWNSEVWVQPFPRSMVEA